MYQAGNYALSQIQEDSWKAEIEGLVQEEIDKYKQIAINNGCINFDGESIRKNIREYLQEACKNG